MANSFTNGYATLFQTALDELMVQEATTGWMEANAGQVIYNGGKDVKIPKLAMSGLGDYSRTTGYPVGDVSLEYETVSMTQDRGRKLSVDSMDVNETNFIPTASKVASEFQRIHVVPEIDAYRLSKLATLAIEADKSVEYGYTVEKAMLTVVQAALQHYHHGLNFVKVQNLYDEYIDDGGSQTQMMADVIMPLLGVSGFFTPSQTETMTEAMRDIDLSI